MSMFSYTGLFVALIALFLAGCSSDSTSTAAPTSAPEVATTGSGNNHFMASTTASDFDDNTTPSSYTEGGDDYCSGKPAGEYCGKINGEMARILIEEHVFYFNYESKVNLKNVPFHIYDCKEFEPDYEAMESVAQEFGLTTDQLKQVLTITYSLPSDSFHLDWKPKVSVSMTHDACEPNNNHDHHGY